MTRYNKNHEAPEREELTVRCTPTLAPGAPALASTINNQQPAAELYNITTVDKEPFHSVTNLKDLTITLPY